LKIANSTPEILKEFMESQGVGIDCSGFVAHILNNILHKNHKKSLYHVSLSLKQIYIEVLSGGYAQSKTLVLIF
jgi:hypothetical protein